MNENALLATTLSAVAIDWLQTRQIAQNPDRYYEKNPLLGKHPSVGSVNRHFAIGMLGIVAAHYILGDEDRKWFLGTILAAEVIVIGNNLRLGINVRY